MALVEHVISRRCELFSLQCSSQNALADHSITRATITTLSVMMVIVPFRLLLDSSKPERCLLSKPVLEIVIASTRPGRAGAPIARWFCQRSLAHDAFDVELVDLAEVNLPLYDEPHQPISRNYQFDHTKKWSATISRADVFVIVMPEYNHSFNAALKNALDFLYHEWRDKPIGLVSYGGGAAGARAIEALKPVLASLGLVFAGELSIPLAQFAPIEGAFAGNDFLETRARAMLDELAFVTRGSQTLRSQRPPRHQ